MVLAAGDTAPDFTKKDQHGDEITLSAVLADQPVFLVFIPFAFTGICQAELCAIRDDYSEFADKGVRVISVSCDPGPSQKQWAEEQGFEFSLVSDAWPHGQICQAYDVFNDQTGSAFRASLLIGTDGKVIDSFQTGGLGEAREATQYQEALAKL
jgi:mycoredoxin-dependent peroxiredoxin